MKTYTEAELKEILRNHRLWLENKEGGGRADLSNANLYNADLRNANLSFADLNFADLSFADLCYADLSNADLCYADLRNADLRYADLRNADLSSAKGIIPEQITPLLILHDQPGLVRAYKLVNKEMEGPFNGGITYEIGKEYEVEDANIDANLQCAAGINLATLDWCLREWQKGFRVLICEFTAKDIACIPTATDGKFRVRKCRVVGEKDISEFISTQSGHDSTQKQDVNGS